MGGRDLVIMRLCVFCCLLLRVNNLIVFFFVVRGNLKGIIDWFWYFFCVVGVSGELLWLWNFDCDDLGIFMFDIVYLIMVIVLFLIIVGGVDVDKYLICVFLLFIECLK